MFIIQADDLNGATCEGLKTLLAGGEVLRMESKPEGFKETKELHPCYIQIDDPTRRVLTLKNRKANISATVAETVWVLFGDADINQIKPYMPRVSDFSDDGATWRAWYGERLFNWDNKGVNQFQYCVDTLKKDLYSRQAVMSLWDPSRECTVGNSKDYPCTNHIQFLYRHGALDMTVTLRSNDCIWGWSHINMFEFTVMQEMMSLMLGVPMGRYYHQVGSFHIYECMYDRAKKIVETNPKVIHEDIHPRLSSEYFSEHLKNVLIDPYSDTVAELVYRELSSCEVISTELCWLACMMFVGSNLDERKFHGKRLEKIFSEKLYNQFVRTDYARALGLSLGNEDYFTCQRKAL